MIAAHRRRIEKSDREKIFIISHTEDFPAGSPVELISGEINSRVEEFLTRDAALFSTHGGKLQVQEIKGDTRDFLIAALTDLVLGAQAVGDEAVPDITAKFRLPTHRTAQNLIATADRWYEETAAHEELLTGKGGLDADFRASLQNARNDFQKALDAVFNSSHGNIEAFERLEELMLEIMSLSRRRSALVRLKYKNNPGKLASWIIASHLEPPPRRKLDIVMQVI